MKFTITEKKKNTMQFELSDTTPALANALRRIIVSETPAMAIHTVEFRQNSSTLYDEILAHRLGLVVLKTDLKSYNLPDVCTCGGEGCAQCQLKLIMDVKGPCTVYAKDMESQDPKVTPVNSNAVIVKLLKGQDIQFEAIAQLGIGKNHARWSPGLCIYTYKPIITIKQNSKKLEEFRNEYPPVIFDKKGDISKEAVEAHVDSCAGVCDDIIKVEYDETTFQFVYEPWGQLDGPTTVKAACDVMIKKSAEFLEKVSAL